MADSMMGMLIIQLDVATRKSTISIVAPKSLADDIQKS
jgi:hypothetical protein